VADIWRLGCLQPKLRHGRLAAIATTTVGRSAIENKMGHTITCS
jgi:hypothetical protein